MSLTKKTQSESDKNRYELEITVAKEIFSAAVDAAYRKNVAKINVPGFRKGKAPKALIEKMYGKGVFYEDAINACIPDAYEEAVKESELTIVGQPDFDVVSADENGLVLKAVVYVKPEIEITNYLGIEAEKHVEKVTDEAVEAEITRARERNARTLDVTDRAAKNGDSVNIDFDGSVNGAAFEGGKAEKYDLKLGAGQFIPGFEEQIVGHTIGDTFDVNVTFPADYHAKELAGKAAVFAVKLNGIKETELPAADDEFAKDVSEFDTFAEYQADVRAKMQERNEKAADAAFEENLIDALIANMSGDIPTVMFDEETDNFVRDYENRLRMQGLDLETYFKFTGMNVEKLKEQLRPQAEKQVKLRLILEEIAKKENLAVSDEDIEAEYKRIADAYNIQADKVKQLIAKDGITTDLKVKAAMDLVKEKAVVKA